MIGHCEHSVRSTLTVGKWCQGWQVGTVTVTILLEGILMDGGGLRVRNVLVEESIRWLHPDAITVKEERTEAVLYDLTADDNDSSDDDE